jgi:hypothetical protein
VIASFCILYLPIEARDIARRPRCVQGWRNASIESHCYVWLVLFSRASGKVALALDIGNDEVILYSILCDAAYKRCVRRHIGAQGCPGSLAAQALRTLDSVGTNRYRRGPENHTKR